MTALLAVLNTFWIAMAIAAAAHVAMKFVPGLNAATRCAIWWSVLAVMLAIPAIRELPPMFESPSAANAQTESAAPAFEVESTATPAPTAAREPMLPLHLPYGNWPLAMLAIWSAVFLFHLARVGWSYRYLRGVKHRATPATVAQKLNFDQWTLTCGVHRPVRLLVSDEIASPMAVGFRRPAVLLPAPLLAQLTSDELDHVLLHELAHVARYDDWTNLMARVAAGALMLHPVAAWVLRRIEREREIACDDWVVDVTGTARPYAASLAHLLELCVARRRDLLATGLTGRTSLAGERIERLVHRAAAISPRVSGSRVAVGVTVLLALMACGVRAPQWIAMAAVPLPLPVEIKPASVASPAPQTSPTPTPRAQQRPATPTPEKSAGGFLAALNSAGYTNLSVDEIIELKTHGATAEFISGINQAGLGKLSAKDLAEFLIHGVSPAYIAEIHNAGLTQLTREQAVAFRIHGVRPEFVRALHDAGYSPLNADEITEAAIHGLRADSLREAKKFGPDLTLKQILKLKMAGVL